MESSRLATFPMKAIGSRANAIQAGLAEPESRNRLRTNALAVTDGKKRWSRSRQSGAWSALIKCANGNGRYARVAPKPGTRDINWPETGNIFHITLASRACPMRRAYKRVEEGMGGSAVNRAHGLSGDVITHRPGHPSPIHILCMQCKYNHAAEPSIPLRIALTKPGWNPISAFTPREPTHHGPRHITIK